MIVTKEILQKDIEQKKHNISDLLAAIQYAESLIEFLGKEEDKKEENKGT